MPASPPVSGSISPAAPYVKKQGQSGYTFLGFVLEHSVHHRLQRVLSSYRQLSFHLPLHIYMARIIEFGNTWASICQHEAPVQICSALFHVKIHAKWHQEVLQPMWICWIACRSIRISLNKVRSTKTTLQHSGVGLRSEEYSGSYAKEIKKNTSVCPCFRSTFTWYILPLMPSGFNVSVECLCIGVWVSSFFSAL